MILYALYTDKYEGFGLTEDLAAERDTWAATPVQVIELGEGEENAVRSWADYFTNIHSGYEPTQPAEEIIFTSAGLALLQ